MQKGLVMKDFCDNKNITFELLNGSQIIKMKREC